MEACEMVGRQPMEVRWRRGGAEFLPWVVGAVLRVDVELFTLQNTSKFLHDQLPAKD